MATSNGPILSERTDNLSTSYATTIVRNPILFSRLTRGD